jgi:hypothetical protein
MRRETFGFRPEDRVFRSRQPSVFNGTAEADEHGRYFMALAARLDN